jgi:hypothetical protein
MKTLLKSFTLLFMTSALAQAELWVRPPYKADENHLPKERVIPREAQEEAPQEMSETKKHQDVRKPNSERELEKIDDEMNEGEESNY